jgi:hypothetical protein
LPGLTFEEPWCVPEYRERLHPPLIVVGAIEAAKVKMEANAILPLEA